MFASQPTGNHTVLRTENLVYSYVVNPLVDVNMVTVIVQFLSKVLSPMGNVIFWTFPCHHFKNP